MKDINSPKQNSLQVKDRTFEYSLNVINLIRKIGKNDFAGQIVARQLVRSATSIGANIIEAQAASSKKDFANYFQIALKSANESIYWLELLDKGKILGDNQIKPLIEETKIICKIIAKSIITIKGK